MDCECTTLAIRLEDTEWWQELQKAISLRLLCSRIKEALNQLSEDFSQVVNEAIYFVKEKCIGFFGWLNDSLESLREVFRSYRKEKKEKKVGIVNYKHYRFEKNKLWYSQYQRKQIRDIRGDLKHFTIYMRK